MNVFMAPSSKDNLEATIAQRIPFGSVEQLINDRDLVGIRNAAGGKSSFHCWAMKESRRNLWNKMGNGDIVLFKESGAGAFTYVGEVVYKTDRCKELGDILWGFGYGWHLIYFLEKIQNISIPYRNLLQAVGYTNPRDTLAGIRQIPSETLSNIIYDYGSFQNLLDALSAGRARPLKQQNTRQAVKRRRRVETIRPEWLESLIRDVERLRGAEHHQEREHESLVEKLFKLLGYTLHQDIRYRQGYVDVLVVDGRVPLIVTEVKKRWTLNREDKNTIKQAYGYAQENGARFVIITNGDYYAVFDRLQGLNFDSNFVGEFTLSRLTQDNMQFIEMLRKGNLR